MISLVLLAWPQGELLLCTSEITFESLPYRTECVDMPPCFLYITRSSGNTSSTFVSYCMSENTDQIEQLLPLYHYN
jgi:hypothetical protein